MIFDETDLPGAFVVQIERHLDERGFFARTFEREAFQERGLASEIVHTSIAWNATAGTVRGMHFQYPPDAEVKLVRCTRGAVLDVIVDLRPESATYLRTFSATLDDESRCALYVPERFAHGYQVLVDGSEVAYQMNAVYVPAAQGGVRFDDPVLGIAWPLDPKVVSDRDRNWPLLEQLEPKLRRSMTTTFER